MSTITKVNTAGLDYETKKKLASNNEVLSKRVSLSEIDIDRDGQLSYNGTRMASEEGLLDQMLDILKLKKKFVERFEKLTGSEAKEALIKMIKTGLSVTSAKNQFVNIIGNPSTKLITRITPGNRDIVSNRFAIQQFENIMNKYPNLELSGFNVYNDGTINLSTVSKELIIPTSGGVKLNDEAFKGGMSFFNNPYDGMGISSKVVRQICGNGMIGYADEKIILRQLTDAKIEKFHELVGEISTNGFVNSRFNENLNRAMKTNASFAELEEARKIMIRYSALTDADVNTYLPELSVEIHKLASKGVDYANCSDRQLQNYPIDMKVWDVINRITDFGSHEYGFGAQEEFIQFRAGEIMKKKEFDTEGLLPILFNN